MSILRRAQIQPLSPVVIAALLLVALGSAARFVHLDRHFYFHDEATTSLRLSGRTGADLAEEIAGRWTTAGAVSSLQRPHGWNVVETVHSLAVDDPQHPPLFFLLERAWTGVAGASVTSTRALAAFFGLVAIACVGFLVRELFGVGSTATAALSCALVAVSPFQVLYSQEAREYSLWTATIALASAILLVAVRRGSAAAWSLYAVAVAAALYTFPNTVLVVLAHAVFLLLERTPRRVLARFAVATAAAFASFLPWMAVMVLERGALRAGTEWTNEALGLDSLLRTWPTVFSLGVLDKRGGPTVVGGGSAVLYGGIVLLEIAALVLLQRTAVAPARRFLFCLIGATALPLMVADVSVGGIRSVIPRYLAPVYLGLTIVLAAVIATSFTAARRSLRAAGVLALLAAVGAAAWSFAVSTRAPVWWNQDDGAAAQNLAVSRALNRDPSPVLLSTGMGTLLQMSHYLHPRTRIRVVLDGHTPSVPIRSTVYAYGSPASGDSAARLRAMLRDSRERLGLHPGLVSLRLPCCSAAITPIPDQFWRLRTSGG